MDLSSGYPFPLIRSGLLFNYPKLERSVHTDVAIIGGGISGALMAYHLIEAGISCVVIDGRTIGLGSTAASTSILQYEIDVPLSKLAEMKGKKDASRAYRLCCDSIEKLNDIAGRIGVKNFFKRKSLYFADSPGAVPFLKEEFNARKEAGFHVEYLDKEEIRKHYNFKSSAAILSYHGAQTDAYPFTHSLLQYVISKGAEVFDRSLIKQIKTNADGVQLKTENKNTIHVKKVVNATGYEVVNFINKKIVRLHSTYAIISEHALTERTQWEKDTILWNTADPYLYITSMDGRILVGGCDEKFYDPKRRDKLIKKKSEELAGNFHTLFPKTPFKSEFGWTGTFGSTKDGLPYIGTDGTNPRIYYALGFGGNGITFSQVAAEIITDLILGKKNSDVEIFSFNRLNQRNNNNNKT